MNLKRQLLVFAFLVGSSSVRSTPIESNHPSLAPDGLSSPNRQAAPLVPRQEATRPAPGPLIPGPATPPGSHPWPDDALPSVPVGLSYNCKGSFYCGGSSKAIAQHAIDGWESFVFYKPGTAMVASHGSYARTTIIRCPSGYSGPAFIGKQIKENLQVLLNSCSGNSCGRFVVEKPYLFVYILWLKT